MTNKLGTGLRFGTPSIQPPPLPGSSLQEPSAIGLQQTSALERVSSQDRFVSGVPVAGEAEPQVLRPSALLQRSLRSIASRFEAYEGDEDLAEPAYWNTNGLEKERRWRGVEGSVTGERLADGGRATSFEGSIDRGGESEEFSLRRGVDEGPKDAAGEWDRPYFLSLGGWWAGRSSGRGVKAGLSGSREGSLGGVSGAATVYSELRGDVGAGAVLTGRGAMAGAWAKRDATLLGAVATGEIHSKAVEIGGQKVDLNAEAQVRTFVGAKAGGEVWADFNLLRPTATLDAGGEVFAGAKAKAHVSFGLGELLAVRPTAEGWAGAGGSAGASLGYDKGKISFGVSAGAALGLGGKLGLEVEVDALAAAKAAHGLADRDGNGSLQLNDAAAGIAQGAQAGAVLTESAVDGLIHGLDADGDGRFSLGDVGDRLQQGGAALGRGAEAAIGALEQRAHAAGEALHHALDRDGDGSLGLGDLGAGLSQARDGLLDAGEALQGGSRAIGQVGAALGRGAVQDLHQAGQAISQGLHRAGDALHQRLDLDDDGTLSAKDLWIGTRGAFEATGDALTSGGRMLRRGAEAAGGAAASLASGATQGARDVVAGLQRGARATGEALHHALDRDGDGGISLRDAGAGLHQASDALKGGAVALGKGSVALGKGTMRAGQVMLDSAKGAVSTLRDQASVAATTLKQGTSAAYQRAHAAVERLGRFFGFGD